MTFSEDKQSLMKRLDVEKFMKELILKIDDPSFVIEYALIHEDRGYEFKFPEYNQNLRFYAGWFESGINLTTSFRELSLSNNTWKDGFYFGIQLKEWHQFCFKDHGLDLKLSYMLAKKCCARFGITLEKSKDWALPKSNRLPAEIKEDVEEQSIELVVEVSSFLKEIIRCDSEFLSAFEEEFKVDSSFVIDSLQSHLGRQENAASLMNDIKLIWAEIPKKESSSILFYLPLINTYLHSYRREKKYIARL